jgi:hypothetical protein
VDSEMDSERAGPALASTGDPRVDQVVAGLAALGDTDLAGRPAVLQSVHDRLREILGELGDPGEPGRRGEQGELGGPRPGSAAPRPGAPVSGAPAPGAWARRPNA